MKHLHLLSIFALSTAALVSCGSNERQKAAEAEQAQAEAFIASQPLPSGQYTASYYDIQGEKARKGPFDGRILLAVAPEESVLYVYENGNRAKINYNVILQEPFVQKDSVWVAIDKHSQPVSLRIDSVATVSFYKQNAQVSISFDPTPAVEASADDIRQRIVSQIQKK